jgi:hypothetical protein
VPVVRRKTTGVQQTMRVIALSAFCRRSSPGGIAQTAHQEQPWAGSWEGQSGICSTAVRGRRSQ